jgi:DedD protein
MAQDDYYYEIQLTNKQLVFYFMAGATGLILSFLAGVMVGRGVDPGASEVQAARPLAEERVVSEESGARATPPPAADLTYAQRLEAERVDERLERPAPTPAPRVAVSPVPPAAASPTPRVTPTPAPPPRRPAAAAPARETAGAAGGSFTLQVGAFRDRAAAESVAARLKGKGYTAFVIAPESADPGLWLVRVGSFTARADAERVQGRLREQEKFDPFIVRQP